ncbi:(2Fe-2S)-binding protein [Streptomyces sp. NPDC050264]|uniref:(2Fe-2S)-binding protein n=1 Tax=Streptomyces sp. NPDC050264 TaxID=3155038 RepID=UPI0034181CFB
MCEVPRELSVGDVAEALRDVAGLDGFFVLDAAERPDARRAGRGRLTFSEFTVLARAVNDRCATDETRVGVSVAHLGLAARLWSPVLACTLLHGIVPEMSTAEWVEGGPALRLADPKGRLTGRLPSLAEAVYAEVNGPLEKLESQLTVKIAPGLLAGNTASALVGSAAMLLRRRPDLRAELTDLTTDLLETGRLRGSGWITGPDLTFRRRSCCLYYRIPGGGKCGDCCLVG